MPKDKYRVQRAINRISNLLWSFALKLAAVTLLLVIIIYSLPWLRSLWQTIAF